MPDKPGNVLRKVEAIMMPRLKQWPRQMRARSGILEALRSELLTLTERIRERLGSVGQRGGGGSMSVATEPDDRLLWCEQQAALLR